MAYMTQRDEGNIRIANKSRLLVFVGALFSSGCANQLSHEQLGMTTGAVVGGVVGSVLTGGSTVGTVAGAGAGALAGSEIAHQIGKR